MLQHKKRSRPTSTKRYFLDAALVRFVHRLVRETNLMTIVREENNEDSRADQGHGCLQHRGGDEEPACSVHLGRFFEGRGYQGSVMGSSALADDEC